MVSLCLLAWKRPEQLRKCIQSIRETADYPYELIINLDGGDDYNIPYCSQLVEQGLASKVVLVGGGNRGVGRSFQNCLGVAEGKYIFKVDTDLTFKDNWLSEAVKILENNPDVGTVSLFDYNHYDPNDNRFKPSECHLETRGDCIIVKDFVSSLYCFRREDVGKIMGMVYATVADDGNHLKLGKLAITKKDFVQNNGFGVNSVYVTMPDLNPEHAYKTPISDEPLVFLRGLQPK